MRDVLEIKSKTELPTTPPPITKQSPPPWQHQCEAWHLAQQHGGVMLAHQMGCVDGETEYLSPEGWRKISEYDGGLVMQVMVDGSKCVGMFTKPRRYVKRKEKEPFYRFRTERGIDQVLTHDHRVLAFNEFDESQVLTAKELAERKSNQLRCATVIRHAAKGAGIGLTPDQIRLMVAIIADGHYPTSTNRATMRLKKDRKIERLRSILVRLGLEFAEKYEPQTGFTVFRFVAPIRCKEFDHRWWNLTQAEVEIVLDEVFHWDGTAAAGSRGRRFYSTSKQSADFVQTLLVLNGRRASLSTVKRDGRKSTDYIVLETGDGRTGTMAHFAPANRGNVTRTKGDGVSYCFTVPSGFLFLRRNGRTFVTGNCGKSRTAIDILQNDPPGPILVVCPKAVLATWPHEVAKHAVEPWPVFVPRKGSTIKKIQEIVEWVRQHGARERTMVVINYDLLASEQMKMKLASIPWAAMVCDESHKIKSPTGLQSKAVAKIGAKVPRRLALTGTPIPHSPLDLFGQFRFLDPQVFGDSYVSYRSRYAYCHPEFKSKVLRWLRLDDLAARFYSRSHRVESADVLDLPERLISQVFVELGLAAREAYDQLRDELVTQIAGGTIDVANTLVKLLRLQQIAGGTVPVEDEQGDRVEVKIDSAKEEACSEILEDLDEPLVVFCRFRSELDRVQNIALRHGVPFGELSGRRNDLDGNQLPDWSGRKGVFAVQIQAGGAGIDLTRAAACVYWSLGFSLGEYEQSLARLHRPGQTRAVRYWQLIAEDTVDEAVYKALAARADVAQFVLDGGV